METIKFENIVVGYINDGSMYACYVKDHDICFSSKDVESIEKKAKAMVTMQEKFLNEFPQYRK